MLNEKFRIFENLFNEKLKVLETANDNLKTENINMKKEITNVKTENTNMKKEMNEVVELFNKKLEGLRKEQKEVVEDLKKENNNLKIDSINYKTEINNLKNRIDILEAYVNIPLSLVEGTDKSKYTHTNHSVLFNTHGSDCSVFLNRIIEKVSFFFLFSYDYFLRVFIIGLFIAYLFINYFFFSKSEFSFTPVPEHAGLFGIVDSNRIKECFNSGIFNNNSFFFFIFLLYSTLFLFYFFIIFYFISFLIGLCLGMYTSSCCLCNNSTSIPLPSFSFPSGTRVALQVNMDDKTLHFFHNGMFFINNVIIYFLLLISLIRYTMKIAVPSVYIGVSFS
jgi:hypothetical protein